VAEEESVSGEKLDVSLTIRLTRSLQQKLSQLAKSDKRTPGTMARIMIEEGVERLEQAKRGEGQR